MTADRPSADSGRGKTQAITGGVGEQKGKRPPFAMVPQEVIESGLDHACVRLYGYIARACGPHGSWKVAGATDIGEMIGMQPGTLLEHAGHLALGGLIEYRREGQSKYSFQMIHNPSMDLINPGAVIPPPRPRAKKPSKYLTPVPRTSAIAKDRHSRVASPDSRPSAERSRPATVAGQSKSAMKCEGLGTSSGSLGAASTEEMCGFPECSEEIDGHTYGDHEPVIASLEWSHRGCVPDGSATFFDDDSEAAMPEERAEASALDACPICHAPPPKRATSGVLACEHQLAAGLIAEQVTLDRFVVSEVAS